MAALKLALQLSSSAVLKGKGLPFPSWGKSMLQTSSGQQAYSPCPCPRLHPPEEGASEKIASAKEDVSL